MLEQGANRSNNRAKAVSAEAVPEATNADGSSKTSNRLRTAKTSNRQAQAAPAKRGGRKEEKETAGLQSAEGAGN